MYLSVEQLENNDTITTTIRIEETMTIRGLRLRLNVFDTPDGTLTLTLKDGATTIGSIALTVASIVADVGTYFHGYVLFETDDAGYRINVDPTTNYKELNIEIALTGHTDDDLNYIGLAKNFDNQFVDSYGTIFHESDMTTEQLAHLQPYGIELYVN